MCENVSSKMDKLKRNTEASMTSKISLSCFPCFSPDSYLVIIFCYSSCCLFYVFKLLPLPNILIDESAPEEPIYTVLPFSGSLYVAFPSVHLLHWWCHAGVLCGFWTAGRRLSLDQRVDPDTTMPAWDQGALTRAENEWFPALYHHMDRIFSKDPN